MLRWQRALNVLVVTAIAAAGHDDLAASRQSAAEPVLESEWRLAAPTADVFAAAEATLLEMGLRIARRDVATGVLITREADYGPVWPAAAALDLKATQTPLKGEFHVFVPPGHAPARVAVGAVFTTATVFTPLRGKKSRGNSTIYGYPPLAAAVAARIATRLGATLTPLSADPALRAAAAVTGAAEETLCGVPALVPVGAATTMPRPVATVKPTYPLPELDRGAGGTVTLSAEVTEHGTLTDVHWVGGVEDRNLVAAASGAARLWRFQPAMVAQCAVRQRIILEMSFSIGRG